MHKFTDRISRILPSATLEMTAKAAELKRENKPVFNLIIEIDISRFDGMDSSFGLQLKSALSI